MNFKSNNLFLIDLKIREKKKTHKFFSIDLSAIQNDRHIRCQKQSVFYRLSFINYCRHNPNNNHTNSKIDESYNFQLISNTITYTC